LNTLKCNKIFNGHQDTIVAIDYCKVSKQFASACLDRSCKVWNIGSKKCYRTFKHRGKVVAVALSKTQCVTGCEQGRVKVWNLETGRLIKMLLGHDKVITALRFDVWHIITASADGYALAWSNQGSHKRCLTALRHPCPVLCMEFMYLRVITGAEDGRVRIWNMISGQCCRIMRGNSQSDPVLSIYAINDRMTINTKTNVLMLSFENIEWDYSHETDKVVSFVEEDKYRQTPLKTHSYPYIRAQRMAKTGSADERILRKANKPKFTRVTSAHSTKSAFALGDIKTDTHVDIPQTKHLTLKEEPEMIPDVYHDLQSVRRAVSASMLPDRASDDSPPPTANIDKRRVSWAFEHPDIPSCTDPSLTDMKHLLKKQIRNTVQTPDFIYLTVSALKNQVTTTYPFEYSNNTEFPKPAKLASQSEQNVKKPILRFRPQSSPSSIDTKTKVRLSDGMAEFLEEYGVSGEDGKSMKSGKTSGGRTSGGKTTHSARTSHSARSTDSKDKSARVNSAGAPRCQSAGSQWRVKTAQKLASNNRSYHGLTSTATETNIVPMLMYPKDGLRPNVDVSKLKKFPSQASIAQNHPLCSKGSLNLKTYTQETERIATASKKPRPSAVKVGLNRSVRPVSCM